MSVGALLPWAEVMGFGLGILRLPPLTFWAMTPRELKAAARGLYGSPGPKSLGRMRLDQLIRQFPDREEGA